MNNQKPKADVSKFTEKQLRNFMSDEKLGCGPSVGYNNEMIKAMRQLRDERNELAAEQLDFAHNGFIVLEPEETERLKTLIEAPHGR